VQWRFQGLPAITRQPAARTLRLPPRDRLDFSDMDREYLLFGWHGAEEIAPGKFRRWTQGDAAVAIGGRSRHLVINLNDCRPRRDGRETTTLILEIDGQFHHEYSWREAGIHRLTVPWIGDGLTHELHLRVTPNWSPADEGGADQRELGIQLEGMQVIDD
jgi:hypothetical protein